MSIKISFSSRGGHTSRGRRKFLIGASAFAAAALSARGLPLASGRWPVVSDAGQPYEMLTLGDSVVWGQGLPEEKKFYSIVRDRLEAEVLRRNVRMVVRAHSGATILPRNDFFPRTYGEVPVAEPSLYAQAATALNFHQYVYPGLSPREAGGRVDLVLLNGGINDIGFGTLVNPATSLKKVDNKARDFCYTEMKKLLSQLADTFPNALLVVTGYFPIISELTDRNTLRDILRALLGVRKGSEAMVKAEQEGAKAHNPDLLLVKLKKLSDEWSARSDEYLKRAVGEINSERPTAAAGCGRALFVPVKFSADECYNAPNTAFWRITGATSPLCGSASAAAPGGPGLMTDDCMFSKRPPQCLETHLTGIELEVCRVAGTGHPNFKGAEKYAGAIMDRLTTCLKPS